MLSSTVMSKSKNVACPLDAQFLVRIALGRYICMEKKTHHHRLLCKGRL